MSHHAEATSSSHFDAPPKDAFVPELPEVETVRAHLEHALAGAHLARASVRRKDIVHGARSPRALLSGQSLARVMRHGKQLALLGSDGGCVSIHLGMSGRLQIAEPGRRPPLHTHVVWTTDDGRQLWFIDPRRFGSVWTHADVLDLKESRWNKLGPDAAALTTAQLRAACGDRATSIKSVLLNQYLIAGIGNIYADESLHIATIRPQRPAGSLNRTQLTSLARAVRRVLAVAIAAGGSTIRDYRAPDGRRGDYTSRKLVYGRAGKPCPACQSALLTDQTASRTTVWCPRCQQ